MECPASQSDHTVLVSADFTLKLWVRCCHPSSSHKETHVDLGPGIDQPDFKEVRGGEILRIRQIMIILETIADEAGEQFTFAFPSVFVFPFGGSMITRVSIDPPSMAHWHRGEVCKKQKADVFCCQANAEGCPRPVLRGEIRPSRHCRWQCKILASGVNFSRNNPIYAIN